MKKKSGQILILVLLIVVVALSVGLSVASRNITNLRTSTQTEQSQRAFSAAEGGVEDTLSKLSGLGIPAGGSRDLAVDVGDLSTGGLSAKVNVVAATTYESVVEEGGVAQINLVKADNTSYSGNITLEWIVQADTQTENVSPKASMEVTFVCQNVSCFGNSGSGSSFSQARFAYQAEPVSGQNGFTQCTNNPAGERYLCRQTFNVLASDNAKLMRIRPFWRKATIKVSGDATFPTQVYNVVSTAQTDLGITRKVQVSKSVLPQLPASFDYVLYSEAGIAK